MADQPVHLVEIEGTTERLGNVHGIEGLNVSRAGLLTIGPTRYAIHALATDAAIETLRSLGLNVTVVEDSEARRARLDALTRQIREAEAE